MHKRISIGQLLFIIIIMTIVVSCTSNKDNASQTVEIYLNALVSQDADRLSNLSCKDWESQALLEMDSFQAVNPTLDGLSCSQSGLKGESILVNCKGKIIATYNDEKQEFDLSLRTYEVVKDGGELRVCGYR